MKTRYLATAIALACAANIAVADTTAADQAKADDIERIVVVSSRVATPLRELATSVTVVTAQDIETRGYATLAEVLRVQPAISVTNSGGVGSITSLRVRGEEGYRTLVRIDGVDISDPTGTQVQPQLAHVLSDNISRVEILRGTQGLMYGADAGGVINIQSGNYKKDLFGSVHAEAGRYDTTNLSAEMGGGQAQYDYYISAADYSTDGFNAQVNDSSADADGYDNTTLHARFGYQANDNLRFQFVARNNDGEGEFDSCGFGDSFSNNCTSSFEQLNLRASVNYQTESSQHELAIANTDIQRENFNQGNSSFLTEGELKRVEYIGRTDIDAQSQIIYGLDWEEESITTADQDRTQTGYYVEYQSEWLDNLFLTAGLRYDDNEDFGEHTSYRVSGAYLWSVANGELKLRSAYGTGFRAPSLFEIEYNRGPFAFAPAADTTLTEETTKGYEIALEYSENSGTRYEIVYFDQKIEDSIYFDLATFSGYLQDIGKATSNGVELIADIVVNDNLIFNANYTYNETEDTAGEQRIRRPKHLANIGFTYQMTQWQIAANMRFVADTIDAGVEMDDYQVLDISARYNINEQLTVSARLENALDEDYQDIAAFNTSGSAGYVGMKYTF